MLKKRNMKSYHYLIALMSVIIFNSCQGVKYRNLNELTVKNGKYYYDGRLYTGETSVIKDDSSHLEIFEGIIIAKKTYKNGMQNGNEDVYDRKSGKLVSSKNYINGKIEGDAFEYVKGVLHSKVTYINGKREGIKYFYKEDGVTILFKSHFKNDELITNYDEIIKDSIYTNIIDLISQKPLLICDPCSNEPNSRGKSIELEIVNGIQAITAEGSNNSGSQGGPSLITIFVDTASRKIKISSNNTTGSIYTGYQQWQDTYPIDVKNIFGFEKENYYGIGFSRNEKSEKGTEDYTVNIKYVPKEEVVQFLVFGGDSWQQFASFYFKDIPKTKSIMDNLHRLGHELD